MAGRLRTIDARTLADAVLEPPGYGERPAGAGPAHPCGSAKDRKELAGAAAVPAGGRRRKVLGHPTQQGMMLYLNNWRTAITGCRTGCWTLTEDPSENLYLATHAGTLADGLAGQIRNLRPGTREGVADRHRYAAESAGNLYGQYLCEGLCRLARLKSWPTAARPLCCWSTICASSMATTR